MPLTEIIRTPDYRSLVHGVDISAYTDIQPDTIPDEVIAHQEYIGVHVISDGSHDTYTTINKQVAIFFVQTDQNCMFGWMEDVLYAGLPSDIDVNLLVLHDRAQDAEIPGLQLELWSSLSDEPIVTLLIDPFVPKHLN